MISSKLSKKTPMVVFMDEPHNNRMQPDFGELALM
jgi:hypothetical protein